MAELIDTLTEQLAAVSQAFCPATPVTHRQLFAGRTKQLSDILEAVAMAGQHAVVYGERGVGKSSIANFVTWSLVGAVNTVHVTCDANDDFSSVWTRVLDSVPLLVERPGVGFGAANNTFAASASELLSPDGSVTPASVQLALAALTAERPMLVFIDEFDRLTSDLSKFADTIKSLSDHATNATIVVVGVAGQVSQLIGEHSSIGRVLLQVPMPRMLPSELGEIIDRGLDKLGMTIGPVPRNAIVRLSQGLPHYTHLLGLWAARAAVASGSRDIDNEHLAVAIDRAIALAGERVVSVFERAVASPRIGNLFGDVLLAAALSNRDERGQFDASALRGPIRTVTGRTIGPSSYSRHLNALTQPERGPALERTLTGSYRFLDPLLASFVLMRAVADQRIIPGTASR